MTENGLGSSQVGSNAPPRRVYEAAFKLKVVRHALSLPENNRHKPISRMYPGLTPVQVRKWIRSKHLLENAVPTAKLIPRATRTNAPKKSSPRTSSANKPSFDLKGADERLWANLHQRQVHEAPTFTWSSRGDSPAGDQQREAPQPTPPYTLAPQSATMPLAPHGMIMTQLPHGMMPAQMCHSADLTHQLVAVPMFYFAPAPAVTPQQVRVLAPMPSPQQSPDPTVHDGTNGPRMKDALTLLQLGGATI